MKIYPKISPQKVEEEMDKIIKNSEGIEIQFFDEHGITSEFNFEDEIRKRKKEYPNLKEIIVHPPLSNYNLEMVVILLEEDDVITSSGAGAAWEPNWNSNWDDNWWNEQD